MLVDIDDLTESQALRTIQETQIKCILNSSFELKPMWSMPQIFVQMENHDEYGLLVSSFEWVVPLYCVCSCFCRLGFALCGLAAFGAL